MARALTPPSSQDSDSNMTPDSTKRNKIWWLVIGRVTSTLLARSAYSEETRSHCDDFFETFVVPSLGISLDEDPSQCPVSFMCDDHTPVEIGWVFKPAGEMTVQYAIEALSPTDGSSISPRQNLDILRNLAIAGQCQGFDISWSRKCTQSLVCPSNLVPDVLQRTSQFFISIDLPRTSMGLKVYFMTRSRSPDVLIGIPPTVSQLGSRADPLPLLDVKRVENGDEKGDLPFTVDPAPDSPTPINPSGPARSHLAFPPDGAIPRIKDVITSKDDTGLADYPCSDTAQNFIDVVNETLDLPNLPPGLREVCLNALRRACSHWALLPRSLQIPLCYNRSNIPQYGGGYADVWKGEYQGRPVAAKVLRVYSTSDFGKIRKRFCKEVVTWKTLRHTNVLPLLGVTMVDNKFVMVSEWMANGNINEFIKAHANVNRFGLLEDVARGLIYMHELAMIHGDLKGANILIDQSGHARLADFGLLTIASDFTVHASSPHMIGGTPRWMSPELLNPDLCGTNDTRPTEQSDCYALGMVIYEVLSGDVPFAPLDCFVVMLKVMEGERPARPEGAEGARFTDDVWQMLNRCWAPQPEHRPPIADVLECLEQVSKVPEAPTEPVDGNAGTDEDDRDTAGNPPRMRSRSNRRRFVAFLRKILCWSRP